MTATFTIGGELSEQGLLEAKAAIENLLREDAAPLAETDDIPDASELALRKARLFREWAGDVSWDFLHTIAERFEPGQEFTFEDLSETFGTSKETVKSWHRSACKIMNKVNDELGKPPSFLDQRWGVGHYQYWMSEVMRDALIAAGI